MVLHPWGWWLVTYNILYILIDPTASCSFPTNMTTMGIFCSALHFHTVSTAKILRSFHNANANPCFFCEDQTIKLYVLERLIVFLFFIFHWLSIKHPSWMFWSSSDLSSHRVLWYDFSVILSGNFWFNHYFFRQTKIPIPKMTPPMFHTSQSHLIKCVFLFSFP